jgi:hypothetical protein
MLDPIIDGVICKHDYLSSVLWIIEEGAYLQFYEDIKNSYIVFLMSLGLHESSKIGTPCRIEVFFQPL